MGRCFPHIHASVMSSGDDGCHSAQPLRLSPTFRAVMDTKNDCPEPPNARSLCTQLGSGFEKITGPLMAFPLASKQAPTRNTWQLRTHLQLTHTPPVSSPVSLNWPFSFLPPLCKVTTTLNFTIPLFPSHFTSSFPKYTVYFYFSWAF